MQRAYLSGRPETRAWSAVFGTRTHPDTEGSCGALTLSTGGSLHASLTRIRGSEKWSAAKDTFA
ncbi:hypothetical protein GCM10023082_04700 [Streptomyces tremellae]|uniref:DUF397 domain-containing protein n=1 Tax=Streptomyces tremellae TaxID=1124239 RepID=A0ABP7DVJ0_9ACTN